MKRLQASLLLSLTLLFLHAEAAAEVGAVTLLEGSARLLRGATWYKVVAGARVEESDILDLSDRAQVQIEFAAGSIVNLAGAGTLYVAPGKGKAAPLPLVLPAGWVKAVGKPPGLHLRTASFDVMAADAIVVMHAAKGTVDFFVEAGDARLVEVAGSGADGPPREAKRGDYFARSASGAVTTVARAPRAFVEAMPKHFIDPLHALATRLKSPPVLVVDHEITYAEAEPWLAGRDRAVFERRFTSRLRDPAFRSAVLPNAARYPTWDRILNPEKYAPKKDEVKKDEAKKAPAN
jgi:hypothetical protein